MSRKALIFTILWAVFINGIIASLISVPAILSGNHPDSLSPVIYLVLQQLGHFQFLSFLISIPLLVIAILLPNKRLLQTLVVLVFGLFLLLVFVDYSVFKLYRFHLNGMVWNMLTGGAMEEIFVFDLANVITLLIIVGGIGLLQAGILFSIHMWKSRPRPLSGWAVFALVFSIQLAGQSMYAWSDAWHRTEVVSQVRFIPLAQPLTMKRFLRKRGWSPDIPEEQGLQVASNGRFKYPLKPMECSTPATKPNILFIITDGARFDMLDPSVMPVWSGLAAKSQVFGHHLSTGNATRFGIYGLFTGLYSNYWFDALNTKTSSVLVDELVRHDYRFGFFSNARLTSPEFDRAVFSLVSHDIPAKTPGKNVLSREFEITRQTLSFIEQHNDQPFFGLVFFDAPHAYVFPEQDKKFEPSVESMNYLKLNNETDPLPIFNRYKNAVYFTDRLTGQLIQALENQGLMDNTIIILTGDHGQEANETRTNSWGHNSNFSKYQIQVPMIIHWPGKQPKTFSHMTSHVDVVPTLMQEVFACNNDISEYSNGQSLFNQNERDFVLVKNWNNQAIVTRDFIRIFPKVGPTELRDYDSYQTISEEKQNMAISTQVIKEISRFYQ